MNDKVGTIPQDVLGPLTWDSEHFGFSVAQITSPELDDAALRDALCFARQKGFRLVYWATWPKRHVSSSLLRDFSGMLVDRKATFQADLSSISLADQDAESATFLILEYPNAPATKQLLALAVTAGLHSRFNVDPRMPKEKFKSLYYTWMNRSTLRELADVVLVASATESDRDFVGMITVSEAEAVGSIGLIAVLDDFQGKGVGSLLMSVAHRWMIGRGVKQATVVTQLVNASACKLYERSGYHLANVQHYYHFWTQT